MAKGALEALYEGLLQARDDIRQKVVEEPWFGRAVTEAAVPTQEAAPEKADSLAEFYGKHISKAIEPESERERGVERES